MLAGAKSVLLKKGSIEIFLAAVDAPEKEYRPHPFRKVTPATKRVNTTFIVLFFKFVLFDFAVKRSLGNAQIACRIFSLVIVFT